jgi:hypothetical protein
MPIQSLSPEQRSMRARMGGLATAARHDSRELIRPARAAFDQKFLDEVDPDRSLPEDERNRRVAAARRLHFTKMAFRSAQVRKARAG